MLEFAILAIFFARSINNSASLKEITNLANSNYEWDIYNCHLGDFLMLQFRYMDKTILDLEKSLFKHQYMSDVAYLDRILDDGYLEVGKSGKRFNKSDVINELSNLKEDRDIIIYNFTCDEIGEGVYLVHYITKNDDDNIFRTSIWKNEQDSIKMLFHQASLYKDTIELHKC